MLWRQLPVVLQSLKVTASAENSAFACDDDTADVGTAFSHIQSFNPCRIHFWPEGIPVFRIAERQNECGAFAGAEQL